MEFNVFESIKIGLASPEQIRSWSYGEVTKPGWAVMTEMDRGRRWSLP